jgi:hypothetical protein
LLEKEKLCLYDCWLGGVGGSVACAVRDAED